VTFRLYHQTLESIRSAQSVDEVWNALLSYVEYTGFTNVLYGMTRDFSKETANFSLDADIVILSNFSAEYMEWYIGRTLYRNGPLAIPSVITTLLTVTVAHWAFRWWVKIPPKSAQMSCGLNTVRICKLSASLPT